MNDFSLIPFVDANENWRLWADDPPQIPDLPIEMWEPFAGPAKVVTLGEVYWPGLGMSTVWRPLGVYREEFWQITGEWR